MSIDNTLLLERNKLLQQGLRELSKTDLIIDGIHGPKTITAFKKFGDLINFKFDSEPTAIEGPLAEKVHEFACSRYATDKDFTELAKSLAVPESYMRAVAEVETRDHAFLVDGRCTILFERHKFNQYLTAALKSADTLLRVSKTIGLVKANAEEVMSRIREVYPNICSKSPGGYKGKEAEYPRLDAAKLLDLESAFKSASWGRFQIMGFNHMLAGYSSAVEMAMAYEYSEVAQLKSLATFIKAQPAMLSALRARNFAKFAELYNGKDYAKNNYDGKMDAAERKWAKALAA